MPRQLLLAYLSCWAGPEDVLEGFLDSTATLQLSAAVVSAAIFMVEIQLTGRDAVADPDLVLRQSLSVTPQLIRCLTHYCILPLVRGC